MVSILGRRLECDHVQRHSFIIPWVIKERTTRQRDFEHGFMQFFMLEAEDVLQSLHVEDVLEFVTQMHDRWRYRKGTERHG